MCAMMTSPVEDAPAAAPSRASAPTARAAELATSEAPYRAAWEATDHTRGSMSLILMNSGAGDSWCFGGECWCG